MFAYTKIMQAMSGAVAVVADAYFNLVTLLLNTTSTNGAQNNTFLDSGTANGGVGFTITRNGNTTQGTFTPFSQTGWSNYFDGTDDYLAIADNALLRFGAGAFTLEAWIWRNASGAAHTIYAKGGASTGIVFQVDSTNVLRFTHTTTNIDSTGTIAANSWTHVAVVREGTGTNQTKLYINGTQDGQGTVSTDFTQTEEVRIGTDRGATADFNGYISNLRFVKGTALYTTTFTPSTTPLTTTSQGATATEVELLTCQSNRFLDNSSNTFTITPSGTPSVQAFSPFLPTAAYDAAVVGGSGYFDGTTDYLSLSSTSLNLGSSDFTIETWVYATNTESDFIIGSLRFSDGVGAWQIISNSSGPIRFFCRYNSGTVLDYSVGSGTFPINTWTHLAITRSGANLRVFQNGTQVGTTNTTLSTFSIDNAITNYYVGQSAENTNLYTGYLSGTRLLVGTALYTTTFTPPTAPPTAITNTQFLANYTNAGIFDSAAKNDFETVSTAQVSTAQAKWGTTSMVFNGTSDYIVNPSSELVSAWGSGDFTVEGWYYSNNILGTPPLWMNSTSNSDGMSGCYVYATGSVAFGKIGVNEITSATGVWSNSQWNHLAVVRSGATVYIYVNGVSVASGAASTYVETTTVKPITLGRNYQTASIYYNGYIDDFRVTKGYARYPSGTTFTPPTAAFPIQ